MILLLTCLRIGATYGVFNQTWDEPAHLATGLEWLQRGTYTFEPLHPPLARVAVALGPYLAGARLTPGEPNPWVQANRILGTGAAYWAMLARARVATLVFFVAAGMAVFVIAGRALGPWPAAAAVFLFATLPPVLAHAGFATTDVAFMAGTIVTLACFLSWLEQPTPGRGVRLGLAIAATVLTKFSALLFLPVVLLVTALCVRRTKVPVSRAERMARPLYLLLRPVWITALVVIWAGYRFSIGPIIPTEGPRHCETSTPCSVDSLPKPIAALVTAPVWPAPELVRGLVAYGREGRIGRKAFLLGRHKWGGWWYFFPVALAIKTPLPFLLLVAAGATTMAASRAREGDRIVAATGLAACGILLMLMPSQVNLGVRHALAIYPLASIVAARGAQTVWSWKQPMAGRLLLAGLAGWQIAVGVRAAPDYIAYFNELAPGPPEHYLLDSDLDWGQDLARLADTLHARGIQDVALAYNGSADPTAVGIEHFRYLAPFTRDTGWIAASVFALELGIWNHPTFDDYAWLRERTPVTQAGRSILLYRVGLGSTGK